MAWRAANSLIEFHHQLKTKYPQVVAAVSADAWGLIGDAAHDPTSDHSPHNFPGWGNEIVTAADFPNRPDLGLDAHAVLDAIRISRDGRVKYCISNRQMFSSYAVSGYDAWTWRPYSNAAKDPHEDHGHLSVVGDARSDDTRAWVIAAPVRSTEEEEMGASFGPYRLGQVNSICIPPVQSGAADPRRVWLRYANDHYGAAARWRIWLSNGDGNPYPLDAKATDGVLTFESMKAYSWELPKGATTVSIKYVDGYDGDVSVCFERM
jgi:hypothetical protein